jgi:regulator of sigma E protease
LTTKVGGLVEGFGAKKAGIEAGDRIIAVDGKKVAYWEELQRAIQERKPSGTVKISLIRNGVEKNLEIKIAENSFEDILGQKRSAGMIGVIPSDETIKVRHGPVKSFLLALNKTYDLTVMTYKALWRMITGRLSMRDSMTGPLGIFYITSQAAGMGIIAVIHLVALLSVSLCIFNLLPLPVLDGGHILFLAIEKIRGKSMGEKAERVITHIGLSLIITLAVLVSLNDLVKFGYIDKVVGFFVK